MEFRKGIHQSRNISYPALRKRIAKGRVSGKVFPNKHSCEIRVEAESIIQDPFQPRGEMDDLAQAQIVSKAIQVAKTVVMTPCAAVINDVFRVLPLQIVGEGGRRLRIGIAGIHVLIRSDILADLRNRESAHQMPFVQIRQNVRKLSHFAVSKVRHFAVGKIRGTGLLCMDIHCKK